MFNIGDKVSIRDNIYGYIVGVEIDPIEESCVEFEAKNYVIYKIRVFKNFYKDGYFDFGRTEGDICLAE